VRQVLGVKDPKNDRKGRGYGQAHQRLRRQLVPIVAFGTVNCARCGEPIVPGEPWDLDHQDGSRTRYLGPSHARCNRATARQRGRPVDLSEYQDDPERGIFWGPPSEPGGVPRKWSRVWFGWRSDPYYSAPYERATASPARGDAPATRSHRAVAPTEGSASNCSP
jgi:hypothetical protein